MPLLDHFHPPLYPSRRWESFHTRWANAIADALDEVLPERYFAEVQTHLGSRVEADVAEMERIDSGSSAQSGGESNGGVALETWAPPVATWSVPCTFPDELEVQVRDLQRDARLVGVIELVSPSNLDRPEHRRMFAAKCLDYLGHGIGLVIADVVTVQHFNLHNEMMAMLGAAGQFSMSEDAITYSVAYRPVQREDTNQMDVWPATLAVGESLPVLPLALRGAGCVRLDLEATYSLTRSRSRT